MTRKFWALLSSWKKNLALEPATAVFRKLRTGEGRLVRVPRSDRTSRGVRRRNRIRKGKLESISRLEHLARIMAWIRSEFYQISGTEVYQTQPFFLRLAHIWVVNGKASAISWVKRMRVIYLSWLSGQAVTKEERRRRRKAWRTLGIPLKAEERRKSPRTEKVRWMLTVLTLLRAEHLPVVLDTEAITAPYRGNPLAGEKYGSRCVEFWRVLKGYLGRSVSPRREVEWRRFHLTTRRGPNGGSALIWSLCDAIALPDDIIRSISFIGGKKLGAILDFLRWNTSLVKAVQRKLGALDPRPGKSWGVQVSPNGTTYWKEPDWGYTPIRKVVGIPDMEGKTRAVAILDYWTQTVLRRVHEFLFEILKSIPQDVTFDQGSFKDKVAGWGVSEGRVLYSVDLTKATDRFPMFLIEKVLEPMFSREWVSHWKNLMVGLPFSAGKIGEVSYHVGNPMGAYSSWASFAVAHHYVMFWCCEELGIRWSTAPYVILGDDILIGDPRLGEKYREVVEDLGVEVSPVKTLISVEIGEFAKRYLYRSDEATPFPVSSVADVKSPALLVAVLFGEQRKGLVPRSGIPGAVQSFYRKVLRHPGAEGYGIMAGRCLASSLFLRGEMPAVEAMLAMVGLDSSYGESWSEVNCRSLLNKALAQVFTESVSEGLGEKVIPFLMWFQQHDRYSSAWPQIFEAVPLLGVILQAEQRLLEVEETIESCWTDSSSGGDLLVRGLCDPLRETSIGLRDYERKFVVSERLAGVVHKTFVKGESPRLARRPISSNVLWLFAPEEAFRRGTFIDHPRGGPSRDQDDECPPIGPSERRWE